MLFTPFPPTTNTEEMKAYAFHPLVIEFGILYQNSSPKLINSMELILDSNSKHVANVGRKIGI